jgi:hypothetical protein
VKFGVRRPAFKTSNGAKTSNDEMRRSFTPFRMTAQDKTATRRKSNSGDSFGNGDVRHAMTTIWYSKNSPSSMAAAGLRLPHLLGWDSFIRYA